MEKNRLNFGNSFRVSKEIIVLKCSLAESHMTVTVTMQQNNGMQRILNHFASKRVEIPCL